MPKISVIVPVYKVEQYLDACVCSILAQTYRDFELILVDDGSPDRCGEICDGYALKDARVRVIHQENQGLSGARNSGMDIAQGKYITFVDSDDLIVPRFLEILLKTAADAGAELSVCSPVEFSSASDEEALLNCEQDDSSYSILTGQEACIAMYNGDSKMPINACGKLFSVVLIGGTRFPVGRIHEDQAFVPPVCYRAKTVAVSGLALYLYRTREESITRERFTLKRYDDIWAIDGCIAFFKENEEQAILNAAEGKRKRLLATYAIYAKRDGVEIPQQYKVGTIQALMYLRRHVNSMKYEYYLAQVSPILAWMFREITKVKRAFLKMVK